MAVTSHQDGAVAMALLEDVSVAAR